MNIVAYCRVSTNKEDQLNSLETQKEFFEEYAKKNEYNLIRIYADEGISGTKIKNRKEFLKMMSDLDEHIGGVYEFPSDDFAADVLRGFANNVLHIVSEMKSISHNYNVSDALEDALEDVRGFAASKYF